MQAESAEAFRLFFVSDIHGSDACFRKLLTLARDRRPDVVVIGGDITGKVTVPIIRIPTGAIAPSAGLTIENADLAPLLKRLRDRGVYTYECSEKDYERFTFDPSFAEQVERRLQSDRLQEWLDLVPAYVDPAKTLLIINCGNDDPFYLDDLIRTSPHVRFGEAEAIALKNGLHLLSLGWTTITPWDTPRQTSEENLREKISALLAKVDCNHDTIFNFHCPPKPSDLDRAPRLDKKTLRPVTGISGETDTEHVGSEEVYRAICTFKPRVGLHGHVHEGRGVQRICNTTCVNPGTAYTAGQLQGAWITFRGKTLIGARLTKELEDTGATASMRRVGLGLLEAIPFLGIAISKYLDPRPPESSDLPNRVKHIEEMLMKLSEPNKSSSRRTTG